MSAPAPTPITFDNIAPTCQAKNAVAWLDSHPDPWVQELHTQNREGLPLLVATAARLGRSNSKLSREIITFLKRGEKHPWHHLPEEYRESLDKNTVKVMIQMACSDLISAMEILSPGAFFTGGDPQNHDSRKSPIDRGSFFMWCCIQRDRIESLIWLSGPRSYYQPRCLTKIDKIGRRLAGRVDLDQSTKIPERLFRAAITQHDSWHTKAAREYLDRFL